MKTLDEVITSLDVCINGKGCKNCPYAVYDEDEFEEYTECEKQRVDALHYLREYKAHQADWSYAVANSEQFAEARDKHIKALADLKRNDPLTWDELKDMEGKPVWVEWDNQPFRSAWFVVGRFHGLFASDDLDQYVYLHGIVKGIESCKDNYGSYWQAYRKERA